MGCLFCASQLAFSIQPPSKSELLRWIAKDSDCTEQQISVQTLEYADLTGSGEKQAILVASTCNTGTAGPDVHTVLSRDQRGRITELLIAAPPAESSLKLFGNRNYDLAVRDGKLIEVYTDTSGRAQPLVIEYKWDGQKFAVSSVQESKTFPTSFDCARARNQAERGVCSVEDLAGLDVRLGNLYSRAMRNAVTKMSRQALLEEQESWKASRDACMAEKDWAECLRGVYHRRMQELRK